MRASGGTTTVTTETTGKPKLDPAQLEALKVQKSYERSLKDADRMFGELSKVSEPSTKAMARFTKVLNKLADQYSKVEHELRINKQAGPYLGKLTKVPNTPESYLTGAQTYYSLMAQKRAQTIRDKHTFLSAMEFSTKSDAERDRIERITSKHRERLGEANRQWYREDVDIANKKATSDAVIAQRKDLSEKSLQAMRARILQSSVAYRIGVSTRSKEYITDLQKQWSQETAEGMPWHKFGQLRKSIAEQHLVAQDMSAGEASRRYDDLRNGTMRGGGGRGGGFGGGVGHRGKFNRFLGVMGVPKGPLGALAVGALGYEVVKGAWNAINTRSLGAENDREGLARAGRMMGVLPSGMLGAVGHPGWIMNQTMATLGYSNFNQIANVLQSYGSPIGAYGALSTASALPNMKYGGFATNVQYGGVLGKMQAMGITNSNEDNEKVKKLFSEGFKTAVKEGLPPKQYLENIKDLVDLMSSKGIIISDESISKMALSGAGSGIPSLRNMTGVAAQVNTYGNVAENLLGSPIANMALVSFFQRHLGTATPTAEQLTGFFGKNPSYGISTASWSKKGMASYDKLRFLGPSIAMKYLGSVGANTPEFMKQAMIEQMKYSGVDPAWLMFAMGGGKAFNQKLFGDLGYSKEGRETPAKMIKHISRLTGESIDSLEDRYDEFERKKFLRGTASSDEHYNWEYKVLGLKKPMTTTPSDLKDLFGIIGKGAEDLGNLRKNAAAAADTSRALNDAMIPLANNMRIFNEGLAASITIFRHARILPP